MLSHQCGHFTAVQEGKDVQYSQIDPSVKYPGSRPLTADVISNIIKEQAKAEQFKYDYFYLRKQWMNSTRTSGEIFNIP